MRARIFIRLITALLTIGPAAALADGVEDFYRGREVRIVVGFGPGGGYDLYARTIARHIGRYIPGSPTIVVKNMDGAGSRTATNWLYNVAPRDGSVIGTVSQGTPMDEVRKQDGVRFEAAKFGWIGNPVLDNLVAMSWAASGLKTLDDVRSKGGLICGGSGGTTPAMIYPRILNALLKLNIKVISGYPGSSAYALAMERGELNCIGGDAWSAITSSLPHFLKERKVAILMQAGPVKEKEISDYAGYDVPLITEFARDDLDRKALALIISAVTVGRPLFTPPGVPPERLEALRTAFDQTMQDREFLADAARQQMNINPISGRDLHRVVVDVTSSEPIVVKRVDELVSP